MSKSQSHSTQGHQAAGLLFPRRRNPRAPYIHPRTEGRWWICPPTESITETARWGIFQKKEGEQVGKEWGTQGGGAAGVWGAFLSQHQQGWRNCTQGRADSILNLPTLDGKMAAGEGEAHPWQTPGLRGARSMNPNMRKARRQHWQASPSWGHTRGGPTPPPPPFVGMGS